MNSACRDDRFIFFGTVEMSFSSLFYYTHDHDHDLALLSLGLIEAAKWIILSRHQSLVMPRSQGKSATFQSY